MARRSIVWSKSTPNYPDQRPRRSALPHRCQRKSGQHSIEHLLSVIDQVSWQRDPWIRQRSRFRHHTFIVFHHAWHRVLAAPIALAGGTEGLAKSGIGREPSHREPE